MLPKGSVARQTEDSYSSAMSPHSSEVGDAADCGAAPASRASRRAVASQVMGASADTPRLDDGVAQCAADLAAEVAGVHLTGVGLFDSHGTFTMQAVHGHRTRTWAELVIPAAGIAHRVRLTGDVQKLANYASESGCAPWLIDMFCGGEGAVALAAVPLRLRGEVIGVLYGGIRQSTTIGDRVLGALNKVARLTSSGAREPSPTATVDHSAREVSDGMPLPHLAARESEMLALLERGLSTRDIAALTGLTVNSVRTYVQSTLTKLGCGSRLEAVARARALGML